MRILLICALMLISGCATHVQLEYGRLTVRMEEKNSRNNPKTIEEAFDKEQKTLIDKRIIDTVEWISNPFSYNGTVQQCHP